MVKQAQDRGQAQDRDVAAAASDFPGSSWPNCAAGIQSHVGEIRPAISGQAQHDMTKQRLREKALPAVGCRVIVWEKNPDSLLQPILRDARLQRAPQDEDFFRGKIAEPHGEEQGNALRLEP